MVINGLDTGMKKRQLEHTFYVNLQMLYWWWNHIVTVRYKCRQELEFTDTMKQIYWKTYIQHLIMLKLNKCLTSVTRIFRKLHTSHNSFKKKSQIKFYKRQLAMCQFALQRSIIRVIQRQLYKHYDLNEWCSINISPTTEGKFI